MTKRKKTIRQAKEGRDTTILLLYAENKFPLEIKDVVGFGLEGKFLWVDTLEGTLVRKHVFNMDFYQWYEALMPQQPPTPTIH